MASIGITVVWAGKKDAENPKPGIITQRISETAQMAGHCNIRGSMAESIFMMTYNAALAKTMDDKYIKKRAITAYALLKSLHPLIKPLARLVHLQRINQF